MRRLIVLAVLLPLHAHAGERQERLAELSRCAWLYTQVGACAYPKEGDAAATAYYHKAIGLVRQRNIFARENGISKPEMDAIDARVIAAEPDLDCSATQTVIDRCAPAP